MSNKNTIPPDTMTASEAVSFASKNGYEIEQIQHFSNSWPNLDTKPGDYDMPPSHSGTIHRRRIVTISRVNSNGECFAVIEAIAR